MKNSGTHSAGNGLSDTHAYFKLADYPVPDRGKSGDVGYQWGTDTAYA